MKSFARTALIVAGLLSAAPALAQFQKPEDAVKYRQSAMALIGHHMGRINAQLKADKPDVQAIAADTALVETLSKLPFGAFTKGSALPDSKAKDEIWSEADKFRAAAEKMQGAVSKLAAAGKAGDVAAVKSAFGAVGGACKDCHDSYRAK